VNKPIRILLVDDNQYFLDAVGDFLLLKTDFHLVGLATNGEDAIKSFQVANPDVILLDLNLGGESGLNLISKFKQQSPSVKIIILSTMNEEEYRNASYLAGADGFIHKSSMSNNLFSMVMTILQNEFKKPALPSAPIDREYFLRLAQYNQDLIYRYELNPIRRFVYVSPSATVMTGFTPEEHYADPDLGFKLIHPEDRHLLEDMIFQADVVPSPKILRWVRKDGSILWTEQHTVPIYDSRGNLMAIEGAARDITQRRQVDKMLSESEARYRYLFDNNPHPMWVYDTNTLKFLSVNDAAIEKYGYSRQEFMSMTIADIRPPEDLDRLLEHVGNARGEYRHSVDWRHTLKNGTIIDVEISSHQFEIPDGKAALVVVQDMTESKRIKEAFQASQKVLQEVVDHAPALVYMMDTDGRFLLLNRQMEILFDVDGSKAIGQTRDSFLPATIAQKHRANDLQVIQSRQAQIFEEENLQSDGKHYFLTTKFPLLKRNGEVYAICGISLDITDRKKADETLLLKSTALEFAANAMVITDSGGRIEWVNPAWSELTGYSLQESVGKTPRILRSGRQDQVFYRNLWDTILAGRVWHGELVNRRKDGSLYIEEETITPVFNQEGQLINIIGVKQDISARKHTEKVTQARLRLNTGSYTSGMEEFLRTALDEAETLTESGIGILYFINEEGDIILKGHSKNTSPVIYNLPDFVYDPSNQQTGIWSDALHDLHSHIYNEYRCQIPNQEGLQESLLVERFITMPLMQEGRVAAVVGFGNKKSPYTHFDMNILEQLFGDVTEMILRKRAEDSLMRMNAELESHVRDRTAEIEVTRQRFELAVQAGEIGVWELNLMDDTVLWDDRMYKIYGLQRDEIDLSVSAWTNLLHPADAQMVFSRRQKAIEDQVRYQSEFRIVHKNGTIRHITSFGNPITDASGRVERLVGVNMDVTPVKKAEEALVLTNAELERALRVKDEFLASMSHELRTPLTGVLGLSELMRMRTYGDLTERQDHALSNIHSSGQHLLELINDILDVSKIEAGKFELQLQECSVKDICQGSIQLIKGVAGKKHQTVEFLMEDTDVFIKGDCRRLKQIFVNLLSNAVKFTPEHGRIGLEVACHESKNTIVDISVWDEGIGIKAEDIHKLFQPFVQIDSRLAREQTGTGLGLALVKRLVEMHDGRIELQSEPQRGSRFTVSFACIHPAPDSRKPGKYASTKAENLIVSRHKGTVVIVDENNEITEMLRDYLSTLGYTIHVFGSADQFLQGVALLRPDLILMDIQLPGMDGLEATRQLRAMTNPILAGTPVIALTALAMHDDRERCLAAGANEYIAKPFRLYDITLTIENLLGRSGYK